MRILPFFCSAAITIGLVVALDRPLGKVPPLGSFFSPQYGFWQNAEPVNQDFGGALSLQGLQGPVQVYFDDRLVLAQAIEAKR